MSQLPVELVRRIFEVAAHRYMTHQSHWVGQTLAMTSRVVYTWVAPILFESWAVRSENLELFYALTTRGELRGLVHARTLIVDIFSSTGPLSQYPRLDWKANEGFLSSCSELELLAVPGNILTALCAVPHIRPKTLFLIGMSVRDLGLSTSALQSFFSRVTHLCILNIPSLFANNTQLSSFHSYLPEVTHILIQRFIPQDRAALQRLLRLPKLERILVGVDTSGQVDDTDEEDYAPIVQRLAEIGDERVFHGFETSLVPEYVYGMRQHLTVIRLARLARDGRDFWIEGKPAIAP